MRSRNKNSRPITKKPTRNLIERCAKHGGRKLGALRRRRRAEKE